MSKSSKSFNFSALNNDVDLDDMNSARKNQKRNESEIKTAPSKTKNSAPAKPSQKSVKKKQEKDSLQSLAFGSGGKNKKKSKTSEKSAAPNTSNGKAKTNGVQTNGVARGPSDDWRNRDEQFVEDQNEQKLKEALLLSKLDYEKNKKVYEQTQADLAKNKKKKKAAVTYSISEFNNASSNQLLKKSVENDSKLDALKENFFEDVDKAVKNTIQKETRLKEYNEKVQKEKVSNAKANSLRKEATTNGVTPLVSSSEVEKRDYEIQALRSEVKKLQDELMKVKLRNSQLCEVLSTAEMKDKEQIILELKKVTLERNEFSAEVAILSEQLEQEKTKVSTLVEKGRKK